MQHNYIPKKLNFDLLTVRSGGGLRSAGKIFATMLLYFSIPLNLIRNMTISEKNKF